MVLNINAWGKKRIMPKVLVVGGAGYIGSHVVKALLDNKTEAVVYDNLSSGHRVNLFAGAEFVQGDILDFDLLSQVMGQGIDAVVYLAAKKAVGESMQKPELYAENNLIGAVNLLNAMALRQVKAIVFSSSAAVYGIPQYVPMDEQHPINPISFYGFTKVEVERYMAWYDHLKGIKYISLRYFNAAGYDHAVKGRDANPQNLLPLIAEVASGKREYLQVFGDDYDTRDGTCLRDYVHVNDLASAHVLALKKLLGGGKSAVYNLGTNRGSTVKEVIAAAEKALGRKLPVRYTKRRPGDPPVLLASYEKAATELGWQPRYTGIEEIVQTELENVIAQKREKI